MGSVKRLAAPRARPRRAPRGSGRPEAVGGAGGRGRARVLARRGPLVDRRPAAPPLLGGRHRRRPRPRRLPRSRGRGVVRAALTQLAKQPRRSGCSCCRRATSSARATPLSAVECSWCRSGLPQHHRGVGAPRPPALGVGRGGGAAQPEVARPARRPGRAARAWRCTRPSRGRSRAARAAARGCAARSSGGSSTRPPATASASARSARARLAGMPGSAPSDQRLRRREAVAVRARPASARSGARRRR